MHDIGVQECMGYELPRHEAGSKRPKGEGAHRRSGEIKPQEESDSGDDDKGLNCGPLGTQCNLPVQLGESRLDSVKTKTARQPIRDNDLSLRPHAVPARVQKER